MTYEAFDSWDESIPLLAPEERPPFSAQNLGGRSPLVIIGDHAGCGVPARLGDLGLAREELTRHIGWDVGVAALGACLARLLDAPFIAQRYSRLVIDCNRDPERADAVCRVSDGTCVPGNVGISSAARAARVAEIFRPYHERIAVELDERIARGESPILVALHSFTPALAGAPRPWTYGVLHLGSAPYAAAVLSALRGALGPERVGENEPYAMDGTDFSVPHHAIARGLRYVELEVRQDLLLGDQNIIQVADFLATIFADALRTQQA